MNGKFQQLVEKYEQYLKESGFAPLSNIQPVAGAAPTGATPTTGTPPTSADPVEADPGVKAAKQKAIQQQEIELKKKANTLTNP